MNATGDVLGRHGLTPRLLSLVEAAAYMNLSTGAFDAEIKAGNLPPSIGLACRRRLWDIRAIDDAVDRLSGRVPEAASMSHWIEKLGGRGPA